MSYRKFPGADDRSGGISSPRPFPVCGESSLRVLSPHPLLLKLCARGKFHPPVAWEGTSRTLEGMIARLAEISHDSWLWGQGASPKKTG